MVIADTAPLSTDDTAGAAVALDTGATVSIERALFEDSHMVGLYLGEDVVADVSDLAVLDTESQLANMRFGRGVELGPGARLTLARAMLSGNRSDGVFVWGPGAELIATDLLVSGTRYASCEDTDPTCVSGGFGLAAWNGAATVTRFAVEDNALAGVEVARGSAVTLTDGTISRHPIALHIQEADFSLDRDLHTVRLVDNQRNVDSDVLPIPEPSAPGLDLGP